MLDHCVRCGNMNMRITKIRSVLQDKCGLIWWREDLACSRCGYQDVDFRADLTLSNLKTTLNGSLKENIEAIRALYGNIQELDAILERLK